MSDSDAKTREGGRSAECDRHHDCSVANKRARDLGLPMPIRTKTPASAELRGCPDPMGGGVDA